MKTSRDFAPGERVHAWITRVKPDRARVNCSLFPKLGQALPQEVDGVVLLAQRDHREASRRFVTCKVVGVHRVVVRVDDPDLEFPVGAVVRLRGRGVDPKNGEAMATLAEE